MSTAIDTNVLVDLVGGDEAAANAAGTALENASRRGALVIAPAVYAELLAFPDRQPEDVDTLVSEAGIRVDWDLTAATWRRAGEAFAAHAQRCRQSGAGSPRRILADFVIGAHALATGTILTRDASFFRIAFPDLVVEDPAADAGA